MIIPNFFVIGAQKCGTDALYAALRLHPQIFMSPEKEPSFFITDGGLPAFRMPNTGYAKRITHEWSKYLALFQGGEGFPAVGEASAIYLSSYYPEFTAARIKQRIPNAKFIALLRQPADRAYSAFRFYHARGIEPLADFRSALAAEAQRMATGDCPDIRYVNNGQYYANIRPFFSTFPREQIRVFLYEDWVERPLNVLSEIFRFLGVDDSVKIPIKRMNVTVAYRSRWLGRTLINPGLMSGRILRCIPKGLKLKITRWNEMKIADIPTDVRLELTHEFRKDILSLGKLIRRDLSHWLDDVALEKS